MEKKVRPVVVNNWEATYFNFNEAKLLKLAKDAYTAGVELFVLDDGWFGKRNDDTSSLGDYSINKKKLPNGLAHLQKKIEDIGLDFGLWVEPEMISEDSDLYKKHPDWVVKTPNRKPSIARNQMVLDLCNLDVQAYLIEELTNLLSSCKISYIKWDYNRNITDMYTKDNSEEFFWRYMEGLYNVLSVITKRFENVLFEGCASGGNRFDLGMLCFFPQIWTSDNTDYLERLYIQTGTSYGYPQSVMSTHVSDVPNHQTLRTTPLSSRFNLACFGVAGYELNISELSKADRQTVKKQIELYKQYRQLFQFGKYIRANNTFTANRTTITVVKDDEAIVGFFQQLVHLNQSADILKVGGLNDATKYKITTLKPIVNVKTFGGLFNMVSPIKVKIGGNIHKLICRFYKLNFEQEQYLAYGDTLKNAGIVLNGQFLGTGFSEKLRVIGDFGSTLYFIKSEKKGGI